MIGHLPKSSKKGAITCAFCSSPAASVCNSRTPSFISCNQPFCSSHGTPHDTVLADQSMKFQGSLETIVIERVCCQCENQDSLVIKSSFSRGLIWGSLSLFFAVVALSSLLLLSAEVHCRAGTLQKLTNQKCMVTRNLTAQEHVSWNKFSNEGMTKCSALSTKTTQVQILVGGGLPRAQPNLIDIRCRCPPFKTGSFREIKDGTVARFGKCAAEACSPNGKSWLTNFGKCFNTSPITHLNDDAEPGGDCPKGTYLNEEVGACIRPVCPLRNYFLSLEEAKCRMCPLFTFSIKRVSCGRTLISAQIDHFDYFEHNFRSSKNLEVCSELDSQMITPTGARKPYHEEQASVYSPRVVDQFGYWQCPTRFEGRLNRTCLPEEMVIRYTIGCTSPGKPCLEKWDFALKKCVPAEIHCQEAGLVLITSGECSSGSKNSLETLELNFYETKCLL